MLTCLAIASLALAPGSQTREPARADSAAGVDVRVDSAHHEVVVTVRRIHIPEGTYYGHQHAEAYLQFLWPVRGWARGYRVDVLDSVGRALPREVLHHAGIADLDRRQLPYPMPLRLFAAGRETPALMLPASMGVPMTPDEHLVLYYMLVNPAAAAIDGATLRISIAWTPDRAKGPRNVFPLSLDANPAVGGARSFDLPPGVSITSAEFTIPAGGYLRAVGGHVHDYAVELRLEDAATNKVLARITAQRDSTGRITGVSSDRFLFKWRGLHLAANQRYRVVSVYDNPTCTTIPSGAMAFMVGPFIPDDVRRWPAVDPANPLFLEDYAELVSSAGDAGHPHDMAEMKGMADIADKTPACRRS
ncbi:MAG TPA: hypothetical protein VHE78_16905 [Gemmatimonadaceae bacterium]|nr:hypothetical protein [Gemmatimonadaceae bacterium]